MSNFCRLNADFRAFKPLICSAMLLNGFLGEAGYGQPGLPASFDALSNKTNLFVFQILGSPR